MGEKNCVRKGRLSFFNSSSAWKHRKQLNLFSVLKVLLKIIMQAMNWEVHEKKIITTSMSIPRLLSWNILYFFHIQYAGSCNNAKNIKYSVWGCRLLESIQDFRLGKVHEGLSGSFIFASSSSMPDTPTGAKGYGNVFMSY